jgi:hypothetical protein
MGDVATTKLMENDRVIVWEFLLAPGERTDVHTHEHDYIIQVIEGSQLRALDANGNNPVDLDFKDGDTYWVEVRDGEIIAPGVRVSATHAAENIGDRTYREILVEIK